MTEGIDALIAERARTMPEAIAVLDTDGRAVSFLAHDQAINAATDALQEAGLRPGDRLMIVAENCHAAAVLILASARAGAVAVPINARMSPSEIVRVVEHADPRVMAFTVGMSPEAWAHAERMGAKERDIAPGGVALAVRPRVAADDTLGDVAVLLYTTGTTGAPKGVMLTHANLRFAGRSSAELRGMAPGDRIYGVLPMTHVFGLASMLVAASHAGTTIQMEPRFRPESVHAALLDGVTVFPAVPQMHALLMEHVARLGLERLEGGALRYVSSGAAPLDPVWKRKAEAFYGVALQNGYGMTETTAGICATCNPKGSPDVSAGRPLPGVEARIDEAAGGEEAGVGEIMTRGPHVMAGYYRDPEATARMVDAGGWLRTGDLGRIDGEGCVHVVGRSKELIIRGGFNVYPPEVEAALNEHPDIVQSAVIGRSLPGGDEEVLAFVQCAEPDRLDLSAVRNFVAGRLTGYKRPARIVATTALPAASTGKILKHKLLETFAEELSRLDWETASQS